MILPDYDVSAEPRKNAAKRVEPRKNAAKRVLTTLRF
jgi:hypothetical protein